MTTVDRAKTLAELAAAPTLTAGNIAAAIKALGRDGVLDAADQAGLASVIARHEDVREEGLAVFQRLVGYRPGVGSGPQISEPADIDAKRGTTAAGAMMMNAGDVPIDLVDVILDLSDNRAYINAKLIGPEKLEGLIEELNAEIAWTDAAAKDGKLEAHERRVREVYRKEIVAKLRTDDHYVDDYDLLPVKTEVELGLPDSDREVSTFVSFPVVNGERTGSGWRTPRGTFLVAATVTKNDQGELQMRKLDDNRQGKQKNRDPFKWLKVPRRFDVNGNGWVGFHEHTGNPFGPRWMRLHRVMTDGTTKSQGVGLHGTVGFSNWASKLARGMLPDGQRNLSHGCVRFTNDAIVRLYRYLPPGTVVRIVAALPGPRDVDRAPADGTPGV